MKLRHALVGLVVSLAMNDLVAQHGFCHPDCTAALAECPGDSLTADECADLVSQAIDCISDCAIVLNIPGMANAAGALDIAFENGWLRVCPPVRDDSAWTLYNCRSGTKLYWCAGHEFQCICINGAYLQTSPCRWLGAQMPATETETKWILAGLLVHEMCHAQTFGGSLTPPEGGGPGGTYTDPCGYYCNEVLCNQLEKDLLSWAPISPGIHERLLDVQKNLDAMWDMKTAACADE